MSKVHRTGEVRKLDHRSPSKPTSYRATKKFSTSRGQTRIPCPPQIVAGLDTVQVSLSMKVEDRSVLDRFKEAKKLLQQTTMPSAPINFGEYPTSEEYFRWNLQRVGTKLYPYVLRSGDVTLLLSTREGDAQIPNVKIEIGSVSCQADAFGIYDLCLKWLSLYGFKYIKDTVSRTDLCCDVIGTYIEGLGVSSRYRWVKRARDFNIIYSGDKLSYVRIGSGDILLRVYDKILELKKDQSKQDFFFDLWGFTQEQKDDPPPVTRVEFQLRREKLKEFETPVNNMKELKENVDSIWQYCTQHWARLTNRSVHLARLNNNQHLVPSSKFWKKIQLAIFTRPLPSSKRGKKLIHKDLAKLRAQARGCLLNIAAAMGHDVKDTYGIVGTVLEAVQQDFYDFINTRSRDFEKLFKIRRNECCVGF